jgi:hypothetical protein
LKNLVIYYIYYIALPEAVRRSSPEEVLIMTNFGSIDSTFKNLDSHNNIKTLNGHCHALIKVQSLLLFSKQLQLVSERARASHNEAVLLRIR